MSITSIFAVGQAQGVIGKKPQQETADVFASLLTAETSTGDMNASSGGANSFFSAPAPAATSPSSSKPAADISAPDSSSDDDSDAAIEEFLAFASMSPAEKMRYLILKEHGLTEKDLQAMSPAERAKIEKQIEDEIETKLRRNLDGGVGGQTASSAPSVAI